MVWLVLGIIWFIAQIVSKARRSGAPRPPPVPRPRIGPQPIEQDLKELLEALSGQPMGLPPEPPKPLPPIPYEARAPQQMRPQPPKRKLKAKVRAETRAPAAAAAPPAMPDVPAPAAHPPEVPAFSRQVRTTFHIATSKGLTLPRLPKLPHLMMGENIRYAKVSHVVHQQFKTRKGIHDAMISRVVLGPPKGLD